MRSFIEISQFLTLSIILYININLIDAKKETKSLTQLIEEGEMVVDILHNEVLKNYQTVCEDNCECSWHACSNLSKELDCNEDYPDTTCPGSCPGSKTDIKSSGVIYANKYDQASRDADVNVQTVCYTRQMTPTFEKNYKDNKSVIFQYFGSAQGVYRTYPLKGWCSAYDARTRGWYNQAISDPKNIVIVLENSSYMTTNGRAKLAQEVVDRILISVSLVDRLGFMSFNERTLAYFPYMEKGSSAAKSRLISHVDGLLGYDGSNMEKAGNDTFEYIRKSEANGNLLNNAGTIVFFITSGISSKGENSKNALLKNFQDNNAENTNGYVVSANIFPIIVGNNNSSVELFKTLACQERGLFAQIKEEKEIHSYFLQYMGALFSNKKSNDIIWTEPYVDANGAGMVVTAAKAVLDNSVKPARLLGVAAIDMKMTEMLTLTDMESLTLNITNRSSKSILNMESNNCVYDQFRNPANKCIINDLITNCANTPKISESAKTCSLSFVTNGICGEDKTPFKFANELPVEYKCCTVCITFNRNAIIASVTIAVGLLVIIVILLICCIQRGKRQTNLSDNEESRNNQINTNNP
jgi:hypothetical protein